MGGTGSILRHRHQAGGTRDLAEAGPTDQDYNLEAQSSLNEQRITAVVKILRERGAQKVIDLGCGEGQLIRALLKDKQFVKIVGLDVSIRSLEIAAEKLNLNQPLRARSPQLELIQGSLMYRDKRLEGFDAAVIVEVVEHLDPPRLASFERVVFECARPRLVVLTTPNREYNVTWSGLHEGGLRHEDHRFEWTRSEFQEWAGAVARKFGYDVSFASIGPEHPDCGSPTQMGVFEYE